MSNPRQIQLPSQNLRDLLSNFGIVSPPALWFLDDTLIPVSIVDSRVSFSAVQTALTYDARVTQGELAAPAANTNHADTGPLAAGTYQFAYLLTLAGAAASVGFRIRHRNAADAADITSTLVTTSNTISLMGSFVEALALNERVRIENSGAGAGTMQGVIWFKKL
jgi:hypothetical protein